MDLSVNLAGMEFEHRIIGAAGTAKSLRDAEAQLDSALAAITIGSGTKKPRDGNEGKTIEMDQYQSANSQGLPNPGLEAYKAAMPELKKKSLKTGKPIIFSASGFSPDENAELAVEMLIAGADAIEVNLACPNVWYDGKQKGLACYDPRMIERIAAAISHRLYLAERDREPLPPNPRIAYKFAYCPDPGLRGEVTAVIVNAKPRPAFVTFINTLGSSKWLDNTGLPQITATDGMGGMGGPNIKPQGIGMVVEFRKLLPDDIKIVGVGGVSNAQDVLDYLNHGATLVGMATRLLRPGGLRDVGEILAQFTTLVGAS